MDRPADYLFDDGVVRIGHGTVWIKGTTYPVHAINSVRIEWTDKSLIRWGGLILAVLFVIYAIANEDLNNFGPWFGLFIGTALFFFSDDKHTLFIRTIGGEQKALESNDRKYVADIRSCIEQCFPGAQQPTQPGPSPRIIDVVPISDVSVPQSTVDALPPRGSAPSRSAWAAPSVAEWKSVPASPTVIASEPVLPKRGPLWFFDKFAFVLILALLAGAVAFIASAAVEKQTGRNVFSAVRAYLSADSVARAIDDSAHELEDKPEQRPTPTVTVRPQQITTASSDFVEQTTFSITKTLNPPRISASTNLPDGTKIIANVHGDMPKCYPKCLIGNSMDLSPGVEVHKGQFDIYRPYTGINSWKTDNTYTVDLHIIPGGQPDDIKKLFGSLGENLRGGHVVYVGEGGNLIPVKLPRVGPVTETERFGGYQIHHSIHIRFDKDGHAQIFNDQVTETQHRRSSMQEINRGRKIGNVDQKIPSLLSSMTGAFPPVENLIAESYERCLIAKIGENKYNYTSRDGGKTALLLVSECDSEWDSYLKSCMKLGLSDGACTLWSGNYAMLAIKSLGK